MKRPQGHLTHLTSGHEKVMAFVSKFEACKKRREFAADLFYIVLTTATTEYFTMQEFLDYANPDQTPWEDFFAHMCAVVFRCKDLERSEPRQQANAFEFLKKWHEVVKLVTTANAEQRAK